MKSNTKPTMSVELQKVRDQIKAVPPNNFEQLMGFSKEAAQAAQTVYERLAKEENAPRELVEALRLNITTFTLTMEKFNEYSYARGTDVKEICEAYMNTFQVLIQSSEKSFQNISRVS